jgi:uncharacterized delta-60 repeat protein
MRPSYFRSCAADPARARGARRARRRLLPAAAGLLALQLALAAPAQAAGGDLDPSFGTGGKVVTDLDGFQDEAWAVAVQPDGKVVAGGFTTTDTTHRDFALARYQPDGTPDPSFGAAGRVTFDFGGVGGNDWINSVALLPDGKIIAAGSTDVGLDSGFALARFQPDGTLDPAFGVGGKVTTLLGGTSSRANAMAVHADGKIVVVGSAFNPPGGLDHYGVARYLPDGTLDPSFGFEGIQVVVTFGDSEVFDAVALQGDGKIIAAGRACTIPPSCSFTLIRFLPDGNLDLGFGTNGEGGGVVIGDFDGDSNFGNDNDQARAVAIQPDGKIVAAGNGLGNAFALARYLPDGSLDRRFGDRGQVTIDVNGGGNGNALVLQADGKLVVGGFTGMPGTGSGLDFTLFRLTPRGRLDRRFGVDGAVFTDFGGGPGSNNDIVRALAIQGDGKLVAAGSGSGDNSFFALARYLAS